MCWLDAALEKEQRYVCRQGWEDANISSISSGYINVAKIHASPTQMFNVINPSWSHSVASEVANLKPVNIRYAAINQFYY